MIEHRRALDLAATAIDFPLDAAERGLLESHIRECSACRAEVSAFREDAARLSALPEIRPPSWVRGAIGRTHRPNRFILLAAAALLLTASAGAAFLIGTALRDDRVVDVRPSVNPIATVSVSGPPTGSPIPTPAPIGSPPVVTAGSLPAGSVGFFSGGIQMAPGPDGGLYVLITRPRQALAGPPSQTVLALLDTAGQPRPGWPVELTGWDCWAPNRVAGAFSTATDGTTRLVCTEDVDGEATPRHVAFAFDGGGRTMTGWPVELPAVDDQSSPQVVGNDLLVVASQFAQTDGDPSIPRPGAWWMTSVAADGTLRTGARYEVPDVWPFRTARIASDGATYLMATRGSLGAETTEIVAIDVDGVRAGWPQTVDGILSYPTIGPQGRVYFTRVVGSVYAPTQSQTLIFERDGRPVATGSALLPVGAANDNSGAGTWPIAPMVAPDGSTFIVGDAGGHTMVYGIDPSGHTIVTPPYRLDAGLALQGDCGSSAAGCGAWRSLPVLGPDDTVYVFVAAPDKKSGGSIAAIGADGTARAGWPVRLPLTTGVFWSAVVSSDGTIYAMAVGSSAGQDSWTLYAIAPDGTINARIRIVSP